MPRNSRVRPALRCKRNRLSSILLRKAGRALLLRDRLGRIATVVDAAGTRTMTYTDDGQPDTTTYAGGILAGLALHAAYDTLGRRASLAASQAGEDRATTLYTYDDASRLASVSDGTRTFTYGYLANSALVGTLTVNNGTANVMTTTREYDKVNRLLSIRASRLRHVEQTVVEQTVSSHTYAHNSADQRVRADLADGSHWLYEYDALGQVIAGVRHWSGGTVVAGQSFGYAFDDIGNRQTGGRADSPSTYTANALNQYTQRTVPARAEILGEADAAATVTVTLPEPAPVGTTYPTDRHGSYYRAAIPVDNDGAAVWQEVDIVGVQPRAGANDEDIVAEQSGHVFVPATPEAYTYDADGNLLSDGRWSYTWDAENRLIAMETAVAVAPKARLEFAYDAESRRIRKQVFAWNNDAWEATTDTRFLYDGWNLIAEFDHQAATVTLKRSHLWGLDLSGSLQGAGGVGGLLCTTVPGDIADTVHYPAYDGNGNIMLYLADDGTGTLAVSATFAYSPFGLPLQASGPAAALLPFRFSTKYTDPKTRLLYYGYRYYNPDTGRWLNRDLIGEEGGGNVYGMVRNEVSNQVDILGLLDCHCSERDGEGLFDLTARLNGYVSRQIALLTKANKKPSIYAIREIFSRDVIEKYQGRAGLSAIDAWIQGLDEQRSSRPRWRREKGYRGLGYYWSSCIKITCKGKTRCVGADKISHFFQQGFMLWELDKKGENPDRAAAFSKWTEGLYDDEKMEFGEEIHAWLYAGNYLFYNMSPGIRPKFGIVIDISGNGGIQSWRNQWGGFVGSVPSSGDHNSNIYGSSFWRRLDSWRRNGNPDVHKRGDIDYFKFDICDYIDDLDKIVER